MYELSTIGDISDSASSLPTGVTTSTPAAGWTNVPAAWIAAPAPAPADVTYDAAALLAVGVACLLLGGGLVYALEKGYF